MKKLRFPLLIRPHWSSEGLWWMTESNGDVKHHMLIHIAVMQRDKCFTLEIIIGKLAIPIAWIGFR